MITRDEIAFIFKGATTRFVYPLSLFLSFLLCHVYALLPMQQMVGYLAGIVYTIGLALLLGLYVFPLFIMGAWVLLYLFGVFWVNVMFASKD
jgi:hypothetical protein